MVRHLGHIGLVLVLSAMGMVLVANLIGRVRAKRAGAVTAEWEPRIAIFALPILFLGLVIGTGGFLVPEVDGTVAARHHGKGNQFRMDVDTPRGRMEMIGESGTFTVCPEGHHVHKPAWTTAYTCDGAPVGTASVLIWFSFVFELALLALGVAVVLPRRSRRHLRRLRVH